MQNVNANNFHLHKARIMSASMSLPDHFEVIVVGTGLVESCVAAAASRLGHSVLHLDTAGYYGGDFASFTLDGLSQWIQTESQGQREKTKSENEVKVQLEEGEELLDLGFNPTIKDIQEIWPEEQAASNKPAEANSEVDEVGKGETDGDSEKSEVPKENDDSPKSEARPDSEWSRERLLKESRRFNIDLTPRLLYARGSMVELLISSNISRYTEFKSITRVLTQISGRLEQVPSSRSDVFGTKHLSVVEKRILMKFLSYCVSEQEEEILKHATDKSFRDFLRHEKLTDNLIHFVVHSIAMVSPDAGAALGLSQTKKFLESLGRYGSTPFLWSMYGSGELPQAFCRLCAVFGGVYYLGRGLTKIIVKEGRCTGIVTEEKRVNCDYLVLPDKYIPDAIVPDDLDRVGTQRCVYVTERSVLPADKEQISLVSLPTREPVHIIEVGPGTAACPKGLHVLHASCRDVDGMRLDDTVRESLVSDDDTGVRYFLSFTQTTRMGSVQSRLENVFRASGPLPELDFDASVQQGQEIYRRIFPEDEFLPRAPDPEEIIIGEEADTVTKEGDSVTKEGDTVTKEGNTVTSDGDSVTKEGDPVAKEGYSVTKEGDTVTKKVDVMTEKSMKKGVEESELKDDSMTKES